MLLDEVQDIFNEYIYNEFPTHILHISDMKLLIREEVQQIFLPQMEAITEADIAGKEGRGLGWREMGSESHRTVIRQMIRERLPFAILSHRWLATGEPSFTDIKAGRMSKGPGFDKLSMFCRKAREYGCEYVWSDTCCIDKASSAELEEAIRSMFRWYRNAAVCIAYVAQTSTLDDLRSDPWFTRGWTLQELLAPKKIRFFGKDWMPLTKEPRNGNDKSNSDFVRVLSELTGIPQSDLTAFSPGCSRVYEKMLWASNRRTTRVEDVAYSLIGIFDISMPVAYGEGHWAFFRLMEAIIERCREPGVLAWAGNSSPYSVALPRSPSSYRSLDRHVAMSLKLVKPEFDWGSRFTHSTERRRGDRTFTMTKRGLQIKLLIIGVEMNSPYSLASGYAITTVTRGRPLSQVFGVDEDIVFRVKVESCESGTFQDIKIRCHPESLARYKDWAVGIVDYERTANEMEGHLYATEYMCLLLGRSNPAETNSWRDFEGWEKMETQSVPTVSCMKELRRPVETVWLWSSLVPRSTN
ncbi:hypothetical protein HYDPIDRAFT_119186 [Hydnomerulius pinastri MD-312]|uniref:Heterokaryon incompatibility domain-containing protein n=1 Tax=Hydnomerulius pinastri MD-312 TaxID=994086 RepID=A0A0C9W7J0_9AGAM|nr:hypothetical protein HYDPIDRAFT_119186 [Hydnomerulius pinastri MD-312]